MLKTAVLTLAHIQYFGDSIGDDMRIEVEALNNIIVLDQKINHGSSIVVNREVGQLSSDALFLTTPIIIRVIEKDFVFNDIGVIKENLKIDFRTTSAQKIIYQVAVREFRGFETHKVAQFRIVFTSRLAPGAVRYVGETTDGWLLGKRLDNQKHVSLPTHLKVLLKSIQGKREYCTILEGVLSGADVSVKLDSKEKSYLLQKNQQTDSAALTYSIARKILRLGKKTYQTTDAADMRWKKGLYDIEIPDAPHRGGLNYQNAKYGRTWFRIGHEGDRYIHTGKHSLGCITMIEQDKWDALCVLLMKARKGDGRSIGVLEVID